MSVSLPVDLSPLACRYEATTVLATGCAKISIQIPGTTGTETRRISSAQGWFGTQTQGDYYKAWIEDTDNILGYGAGTVVAKFYDDAVSSGNQGWYFPTSGIAEIGGMGRPKVLVAGLYLVIEGYKNLSLPLGVADTLRVNIFWGAVT